MMRNGKNNPQSRRGGSGLYFLLLLTILVLGLLLYLWMLPTSPVEDQPGQPSTPTVTQAGATPVPASVAFPGAEGFGASTPGGRYGQIVFVTNLNDTTDVRSPQYPGSLRWAVEHSLPIDTSNPYSQRRTIIFRVGGIIPLVDSLTLKQPYVTIAGQTAPGDGITLKGGEMVIATHDVIIRGIRIRVGDQGEPTCCLDGINISTSHAESDVYNIIIDHSSVSWAIDENLSTVVDEDKPFGVRDITIQWSIISEGLHDSIHLDEGATETDPHSMGAILGVGGENMTLHHNIFANNWARNPRISGVRNVEVINNVIHGWGNAAMETSKDLNVAHILNNYFQASEDSREYEIVLSDNTGPESQFFINGNITLDMRIGNELMDARVKMPDQYTLADQLLFTSSKVKTETARKAFTSVLNFAGVIFPVRDAVDMRVIKNIKNQEGQIIDSQDEVGAWPDYQGGEYPVDHDNDGIPSAWEVEHGLNPDFAGDANTPTSLSPDGYSWIEAYINSLIPSR